MSAPAENKELLQSPARSHPNTHGKQWLLAGVGITLAIVLAGLLGFLLRSRFEPGPRVTWHDTNVTVLSIVVTRGTNHTFVYPNELSAIFRELRPRIGLHRSENTTHKVIRTTQFSEVFWVTCSHSQRGIDPGKLQLTALYPQGGRRRVTTTGGIYEPSRRIWINGWPLPGGPETHRGVIMHIETVPDAKRLVTIELP